MMGEFTKVKTFTEKPDNELAKVLVESGEFFWNSGIFLWNVKTIVHAIHTYLPEISARFGLGHELFNTPEEQSFIDIHYPYCPNISIDYGIMEKANNVYMQCVDFGWADLGTWGSLFEIATTKDRDNNAVLKSRALLYECKNNIIALGDNKRLAIVQGLDDYIVAENGNVLLICKKEDEQRIKLFMTDARLSFDDEYS